MNMATATAHAWTMERGGVEVETVRTMRTKTTTASHRGYDQRRQQGERWRAHVCNWPGCEAAVPPQV
uniref:Uncharacterized protein n=1 Tax=Arundo donax TaxID=35708 RepID=A0A0A8Z0W3_ARUDO